MLAWLAYWGLVLRTALCGTFRLYAVSEERIVIRAVTALTAAFLAFDAASFDLGALLRPETITGAAKGVLIPLSFALVYFLAKTPFQLHDAAQKQLLERDGQITYLKARIAVKAVEGQSLETQRKTASEALTAFEALLLRGDELKTAAKWGNQVALGPWAEEHQKWRLDLIDALERHAPSERFEFERLRKAAHEYSGAYPTDRSRDWFRALMQLDAERAALERYTQGARDKVRTLAAT